MQPKKLEHHKYFALIAMTICIVFAGFVGMITLETKKQIDSIQQSILNLEQHIDDIEIK